MKTTQKTAKKQPKKETRKQLNYNKINSLKHELNDFDTEFSELLYNEFNLNPIEIYNN